MKCAGGGEMNYYHYTDINGLKGILENKEIWLTDTRFLNDSTEGKEFLKYLSKSALKIKNNSNLDIDDNFIDKIKKDANKIINEFVSYTASFCSCEDLLSQWRGYATRGGYSISFNDKFKGESQDESFDFLGYDIITNLQRCVYRENQKEDLSKNIIVSCVNDLNEIRSNKKYNYGSVIGVKYILGRNFLFKNKSFEEESEYRIIRSFYGNGKHKRYFRCCDDFIIPYVKLMFNINLVDEIIIGPSRNAENAYIGLKELLSNLGSEYTHIKIRHSSIPYRAL